MKKIISLALVFVFVFALAIPAFAEVVTEKLEVTDVPVGGRYDPQEGNAEVTYNVFGNYIVTVPDAISLTASTVNDYATTETPLEFNASLVLIPYGSELRVSVGGAFKIVYNDGADDPDDTTNEDEVTFKITPVGGADIKADSEAAQKVILTVNKNGVNGSEHGTGASNGEVEFNVTTTAMPKYNEKYTGTITFTTSVVDLTP